MAALVLIFSPADRLGFVLLYVFIAAVAAALVNPRKDALLQLSLIHIFKAGTGGLSRNSVVRMEQVRAG